MEKDFGYVPDAGKKSVHPEIARINAEIDAIILTDEEIKIVCARAIREEKAKIYRLARQNDTNFRAPKEELKIIIDKGIVK